MIFNWLTFYQFLLLFIHFYKFFNTVLQANNRKSVPTLSTPASPLTTTYKLNQQKKHSDKRPKSTISKSNFKFTIFFHELRIISRKKIAKRKTIITYGFGFADYAGDGGGGFGEDGRGVDAFEGHVGAEVEARHFFFSSVSCLLSLLFLTIQFKPLPDISFYSCFYKKASMGISFSLPSLQNALYQSNYCCQRKHC